MRFNITTSPAALVGNIVVPAPVSAIVIVTQNNRVLCEWAIPCVLNVANSVEFFTDLSFDDLVLLGLQIPSFEIKVKFVVGFVSRNNFSLVHVQWNRQNSRQREIWVLDIFAVNFFIYVQKVWILKLLNRLVSDFASPKVHSEAAIFQYHLLQIVELITPIIVSLEWCK